MDALTGALVFFGPILALLFMIFLHKIGVLIKLIAIFAVAVPVIVGLGIVVEGFAEDSGWTVILGLSIMFGLVASFSPFVYAALTGDDEDGWVVPWAVMALLLLAWWLWIGQGLVSERLDLGWGNRDPPRPYQRQAARKQRTSNFKYRYLTNTQTGR